MKHKLASIVAFAALLAIGCGGGGVTTPSPFAGTYNGTWSSTALNDSGTVSVTVLSDGDATGSLTDTGQGVGGGVLLGHVDNNGSFSGTSQYPGQAKTTMTGALSLVGNTLTGNMIQSMGGNNYAVTFTMTN